MSVSVIALSTGIKDVPTSRAMKSAEDAIRSLSAQLDAAVTRISTLEARLKAAAIP